MKIHIVKKGDTLYQIAQKHHVTLEQLMALNPQIEDPDKIEIGRKVKVPVSPKQVEPPASEYAHKHIVKQGDTLWKLSKAWEIPLQVMIKANPHLKNPNVLLTGDTVYIPKPEMEPQVQAQAAAFSPHTPIVEVSYAAGEAFTQPETYAGAEDYTYPAAPAYEQAALYIPEPSQIPSMPAEPASSSDVEPFQFQLSYEHEKLSYNPAPQADEYSGPILHEPYQQAVHPFQQMNIPASEVFAPFPDHTGYVPAGGGYSWVPQQTHSDGGCGCGGSGSAQVSSHTGNWNYPAYAGAGQQPYYFPESMQNPYQHEGMQAPYYPSGTDPEYAYYPQTGFPPGGFPYPSPYSSPLLPAQAHIGVWDKDIQDDREESGENTKPSDAGKSKHASKKTKASASSPVRDFVRSKQAREARTEARPNQPWINV